MGELHRPIFVVIGGRQTKIGDVRLELSNAHTILLFPASSTDEAWRLQRLKKENMKQDHATALRVLSGLRLQKVGRAADMLCMHFGDLQTVTFRSGQLGEVGEWALHLQTPWRISVGSTLLVGARDIYTNWETGEVVEYLDIGDSRFDRLTDSLNQRLKNTAHYTKRIACDGLGGVRMAFDNDLFFDAFSNISHDHPEYELWRLFEPATGKKSTLLLRRQGRALRKSIDRSPLAADFCTWPVADIDQEPARDRS